MLLLAAMFACGIAASSFFSIGIAAAVAACVVSAVAAIAFSSGRSAAVLVALAFLLAGSVVYQVQLASIMPDRVRSIYDHEIITSSEPVEITGVIAGNKEATLEGFFVRVKVGSISHRQNVMPATGTVRLFAVVNSSEMAADYARLDLKRGTKVRIRCELERDDGFRNHGVLSRKTLLDWQDLDAGGIIKSPLLVENLRGGGSDLTAFIFGFREELITKFRELFSRPAAGVMIASLLGNKHYLDTETATVFREGGTFHILVISGLHITFIGGLAAIVVGWFTRRTYIKFVAVCTFLWLYTVAVGAEVPVVRASLMFTVLWFSYVIHRSGSLANALGTCGLILLVWRPGDLFTPSFQLTFVSVAAIVLAGFPLISTFRKIGDWTPRASEPFPPDVPKWLRRFCETLYWNPKRWEIDAARNVWKANLFKSTYFQLTRPLQKVLAYLFEGVLVSLIVQIAMLPLVVHYFHRVTPVSVLLNLWAGVFIALESFASVFAVLFSYVSWSLALPFIRLTEMLHWLLVGVPGYFSNIRWLSFRVPVYAEIEAYLYAAYFLLIVVLAVAVFAWDPFRLRAAESRANLKLRLVPAAATTVLGGIIIFHPFSEPRPDGRLHVEFLDVGQGDSIFITFPNGATMLVDGGGRPSDREEDEEPFQPDVPSIGETVVSEFLWEKGYSQIDHIVGTHADADHIQGLADVTRNFQIGQAWFGLPQADDADQLRLTNVLSRYGVPVRNLARGDRFEIGGTLVEILNPPAAGAHIWKENDRSLVIRLTHGNSSFLLTGDIEQTAEYYITYTGQNISADVVKVPHHGSRTSSSAAIVENVNPQFAIIPVGRRSMFGHPHKEVVERWRAGGSTVLMTGDQGAISFSTDGNEIVFASFAGNRE